VQSSQSRHPETGRNPGPGLFPKLNLHAIGVCVDLDGQGSLTARGSVRRAGNLDDDAITAANLLDPQIAAMEVSHQAAGKIVWLDFSVVDTLLHTSIIIGFVFPIR